MIVASLIVGALGVFAFFQAKDATDQRDTAQATLLATNALAELPDDPGQALALGMRAYAKKHTDLAEAALRLAASQAAPQTILRTGQGFVAGAAFAGDQRHVASAGADGTVRVFDWRAPRTAPTILRTG